MEAILKIEYDPELTTVYDADSHPPKMALNSIPPVPAITQKTFPCDLQRAGHPNSLYSSKGNMCLPARYRQHSSVVIQHEHTRKNVRTGGPLKSPIHLYAMNWFLLLIYLDSSKVSCILRRIKGGQTHLQDSLDGFWGDALVGLQNVGRVHEAVEGVEGVVDAQVRRLQVRLNVGFVHGVHRVRDLHAGARKNFSHG